MNRQFLRARAESGKVKTALIDVKELAWRLNVPASFIYDRTRKHGPDSIPHIKLGKYVRFDWAKVELWLEDHERGK